MLLVKAGVCRDRTNQVLRDFRRAEINQDHPKESKQRLFIRSLWSRAGRQRQLCLAEA